MLRRIAEQRRRLILNQAQDYLDPGETVLHWVRARQVGGRAEGFVFLTKDRCIIHWTGRQASPGSFEWAEIVSWGVGSDARGGPVLALETADGRCLVQLRASTAAMAEDVASFVSHFSELAPWPRRQVSGGDEFGGFEPTSSPAVKQHRMSVTDHTLRVLVTVLGISLIIGAIVIIPLPGPWSLVVTLAGLALLAREYDWARDAMEWTKQRYKAAANKIKARRQSA